MFLKSLLTSLFQREGLSRLVFLFSLILSSSSFATTSNNIYDAKGNMIASCGEEGCEYFIYQAVSRIGTVKDNQFSHQSNGIDGKAGEIVRGQSGVVNSQLWIPDFHGSVIAKLTNEESETILFDAFGGVLNESSNSEEDCQDYHYTDKPRVGCTSLHNFNARFYDPKIGRFITTDPIEQHNLNWFTYVNNNPLSFVDPDGNNPRITATIARYQRANTKYVNLWGPVMQELSNGASAETIISKLPEDVQKDIARTIKHREEIGLPLSADGALIHGLNNNRALVTDNYKLLQKYLEDPKSGITDDQRTEIQKIIKEKENFDAEMDKLAEQKLNMQGLDDPSLSKNPPPHTPSYFPSRIPGFHIDEENLALTPSPLKGEVSENNFSFTNTSLDPAFFIIPGFYYVPALSGKGTNTAGVMN